MSRVVHFIVQQSSEFESYSDNDYFPFFMLLGFHTSDLIPDSTQILALMCFQEQLLVCVSCNVHTLCKYSSSSFNDGRSWCGLEEFRLNSTYNMCIRYFQSILDLQLNKYCALWGVFCLSFYHFLQEFLVITTCLVFFFLFITWMFWYLTQVKYCII